MPARTRCHCIIAGIFTLAHFGLVSWQKAACVPRILRFGQASAANYNRAYFPKWEHKAKNQAFRSDLKCALLSLWPRSLSYTTSVKPADVHYSSPAFDISRNLSLENMLRILFAVITILYAAKDPPRCFQQARYPIDVSHTLSISHVLC